MGKILKRKCEAKTSCLKFRIIASKAVFPAEMKCERITILTTSLEASWREVLTEAGYQLVDNLEVQTSHLSRKKGTGWVSNLDETVGAFVARYKIKKKMYLVKVRPSHVTEANALQNNEGEDRDDNVDHTDNLDEPGEDHLVNHGNDEDDGFHIPIISNVRSLNPEVEVAEEPEVEEPEDEDELIDDGVRERFVGFSNILLLRVKDQLKRLKSNDRQRYIRASTSAPACWRFLESVLEINE